MLNGFRYQQQSAQGSAEALGISIRRLYQLYHQYLKACANGQSAYWEPIRSGGNHRSPWDETVQQVVRKWLSSRPPASYSFTASEVLRRLGVRIDRASIRRWALVHRLAHSEPSRRVPAAVRRWQCGQIGTLWQLDASPHAWFGRQRGLFPLLNILDDCSRLITGTRLYPRETLMAYLDFLPRAFVEHGVPLQLYVDYHSFFFSQVPDALTYLGQALRFYDISLRYAPTPQAKGKIERNHQFWQHRLPPFFAAEKIDRIPAANEQIVLLRQHHNRHEIHREIQMTPEQAWDKALSEKRSAIRSAPSCPWWPYVWSFRSTLKVGSDGRVPVGTQRLRIEAPSGTRLVRCLHPNGNASFLRHPPAKGLLPVLLLHVPVV